MPSNLGGGNLDIWRKGGKERRKGREGRRKHVGRRIMREKEEWMMEGRSMEVIEGDL